MLFVSLPVVPNILFFPWLIHGTFDFCLMVSTGAATKFSFIGFIVALVVFVGMRACCVLLTGVWKLNLIGEEGACILCDEMQYDVRCDVCHVTRVDICVMYVIRFDILYMCGALMFYYLCMCMCTAMCVTVTCSNG
jgi:hypothetical protein